MWCLRRRNGSIQSPTTPARPTIAPQLSSTKSPPAPTKTPRKKSEERQRSKYERLKSSDESRSTEEEKESKSSSEEEKEQVSVDRGVDAKRGNISKPPDFHDNADGEEEEESPLADFITESEKVQKEPVDDKNLDEDVGRLSAEAIMGEKTEERNYSRNEKTVVGRKE